MYRSKDVRDKGTASERREWTLPRARGNHAGCMQSMNGEAGHAYSNGIAKVDIQGVLEFVRGREDFVELVRRHMGDDCAQLVRELSQEAKAAEGAATDLCGDFVDFVCEGVGGNAAEYCANRSAECVDAYGECDMGSRFCKGFFPEAAREWTKRSIQEE